MKRKMILPLLAIVFALASAFATKPLSQQMAYFKPIIGDVQFAAITVPNDTDDQPCDVNNTDHLCTINGRTAYESAETAGAQGNPGRLWYDDL